MSKSVVKVGSVTLPLYEVSKGWRISYYDPTGKRQHITSKDKSRVIEKARAIARGIHNQTADLGSLDPDQVSLLKRVISLGITHSDLDNWEREKSVSLVKLSTAAADFLTEKESMIDGSAKNYITLKSIVTDLSKTLGGSMLTNITLKDLRDWMQSHDKVSIRRLANLRAGTVTFFRWCANQGYLPEGKTTAERLPKYKITRKVPSTYSPEEMLSILKVCQSVRPEMVPWLLLMAFVGLRHEEITPDTMSPKSALDWSDFKWDRGILIVRPETSKTGQRRVINLPENAARWLAKYREVSGRVCMKSPNVIRVGKLSLSKVLGAPVGGWRVNALRHSFISYRAAQVGLAQTAMEAGNSESEAKKSYNDAKGKDEAEAWFSIGFDNF